jgi:hypothetical protein
MIRVSSTEFGKEVGRYQDAALNQPVVVTRNGRDRTVMISAEEDARLKRRDRQVFGTGTRRWTRVTIISMSFSKTGRREFTQARRWTRPRATTRS